MIRVRIHLSTLLGEKKWTQAQLARKAGLHHVVISAYENGKRPITQKAAIRIAEALEEDAATFRRRLGLE